jgi:hypothetical protein
MVKTSFRDNGTVSPSLTKLKLIETRKDTKTTRTIKRHECIKNVSNKSSNLKIYHLNIRGISNKIDELLSQWDSQTPHIFCLMEHHFIKAEILRISINNYNLGAHYCHKSRKSGGVGIFVHQSLQFAPMDFKNPVLI